ncbi:hypothetical protein PAXINDRAFT_176598 [Paxillus involutus ATCC 200175]|uniref:Uncharacterized protein n=1 Tax=Paxillus involutus ATCC 200175 TaxID=664439 RepID=A0A0C9TXE5_PAXIN|nr:hypothetical protein PAXINDRAFT_176598 [Paxillus involutus ATCC 200175]
MLVPLTFPTPLCLSGQPNSQISVTEQNFTDEASSKVTAWRLDRASRPLRVAAGGEFGSIYLFGTPTPGEPTTETIPQSFLRAYSPAPTTTVQSGLGASSLPSSPASPSHSRRHSRALQSPSSLSLNQALMKPSARSRVVSGVSHEQVQAPRNFVDFEDEPERLKDLLKSNALNKQTRERGLVDAMLPSFEKGSVVERQSPLPPSPALPPSNLGPISPGSSKGRVDPRSLLSATSSPIITPRSLSAPPSPYAAALPTIDIDEDAITLIAHVLPPRCGVGHGITDLVSPERTGLLISLQESGDLTVFDHDGVCIGTAQCRTAAHLRNNTSRWARLRVVQIEEKAYLILACASYRPPYSYVFGLADPADETPKKEADFSLFELRVGDPYGVHPASLELLGHWRVNGQAEASELLRNEIDGSLSFIYINNTYHVISQPMTIIAGFEVPASARCLTLSSIHSRDEPKSLTIPNPFKALGSKSSENIGSPDSHRGEIVLEYFAPNTEFSRLRFGQECDAGPVIFSSNPDALRGLCGQYAISTAGMFGVSWTDSEILTFHLQTDRMQSCNSFALPLEDVGKVWDVRFVDSETFVVLGSTARWYKLVSVDANGDPTSDLKDAKLQPVPIRTVSLGTPIAVSLVGAGNELLTLRRTSSGRKEISIHASVASTSPPREATCQRLWRTHLAAIPQQSYATLTAVLPLELNLIILGYTDGHVRHTSFSALALARQTSPLGFSLPIEGSLFHRTSDISISASIQSLHLIRNERSGDRFIVGGSDDGGIAIWTLQGLKLCARFLQFIAPLLHVVQIRQQEENAGPLRGCVLCISADGTIVVIAVDGFELLYVIPGASSPLSRIRCGGGEGHNLLMVIYVDGSARLWDTKTGEFRRAMDREKAKEALNSPGWFEIPVDDRDTRPSTSISTLSSGFTGVDSTCTLTIALERFIKFTAVDAKASSATPVSAVKNSPRSSPLTHLRTLLATLLTPGLSPDIDEVCETKLGVIPNSGNVGHSSGQATAIFCHENVRSAWCISETVSASRALLVVAILKTMALYDEICDDCQTVIMFYATSLATVVGPLFKAPCVIHLARQWFDSSNELRHAARILFDAGIVRLSDEESVALVDAWQHHLPSLQPSAEQDSKQSGLALFLCGYMAVEKYSLLSTSSLVDISKSIALYLHDDSSSYRALAIDLCAKGFQIWQHYVDAMAILRALSALATSARKENMPMQNVGPQARLAVLQIASSNTPLFMTTLTLDILSPKTLEHRKSVMQLVAFLIRKKPLILYPNLPRLMEAVVKSLDPNSTSSRDAVLDTATEIFGHVVKTFPTIDFHMATQRLAVGTSEGAFIMYDLKTATQLYVLEGHKKRPAACSFSPDGRRLVTVSLEEGVVLIWKVGSSFTSFFKPGAPPRQGHSGSHPYKTLPFNVGDEANMTIAGTLEWVRFEWSSDRSVRLRIRESTLTFSA